MKKLDIRYICTVIGNLSGVPIRILEDGETVFFHSIARLPLDPMCLYRNEILCIDRSVGYFITEDLSFYGVVTSGKTRIVIGPTKQITDTEPELRRLAFRADVPPEETDAFIDGMKSIVRLPIESVMQMLCVVNHVLSGEKLELRDVQIYETEQFDLKMATERRRADKALSSPMSSDAPAPEQHNTMALEETIMRIVSRGDTAALQEWLRSAPAVRGGTLAAEQLRQRKNMFIVTATLASRAAIRGGMDAEEALSLSDQFIQSCELLTAPDRIINLQYHMILEFTERTERLRRGGSPSKLAVAVANYVRRHLSEPISAEEIARELYLSRPYLSKKFKAETGETLTDFILQEKTEEAKRLLRYTDKTATAISMYLGFSSLGHFSRVFKKYAGAAPHEYRFQYNAAD